VGGEGTRSPSKRKKRKRRKEDPGRSGKPIKKERANVPGVLLSRKRETTPKHEKEKGKKLGGRTK